MNNQYVILRHGKSLKDTNDIIVCWPEKIYCPLTKEGEKQIQKVAQKLKKRKVDELRSSPRCADDCVIDLIFSSDLLRTKQTAEIVGKELMIKPKFDKRLREVNVGILNGKPINEVGRFWNKEGNLPPLEYYLKRFQVAPPKGENYAEIERRLSKFIKEIDKKYQGKNILIIGHQRPLTLLEKVIYNYDLKRFINFILEKKRNKKGRTSQTKN